MEIVMPEINKIIHQPTRLSIMASLITLDSNDQVDFVYLRKILNVTDGNLGAHLTKLEEAGYIKIKKTFISRKPRSFVSLTNKGRTIFEDYVASLESIIHTGGDNRK
jgi:DNA-binding MarR family transcriptional regulator